MCMYNCTCTLYMDMYLLPSIPVGIWCFCLAFLFIYICIVLDTGFLLDLSVSMGIGSSVLAGFLSGDVAPQLNTIALTVKMINIPLMPLPCTCVHVWKHVHTFKVLMLTVQTYMYIVYVMLHTCTCIWLETTYKCTCTCLFWPDMGHYFIRYWILSAQHFKNQWF